MTFRQWILKETAFTWDEWVAICTETELLSWRDEYIKYCDNLKTIPVWDFIE
jgi:hypothetical protein